MQRSASVRPIHLFDRKLQTMISYSNSLSRGSGMLIQVRGVLVHVMSGTELSRVRTEFRLHLPEPINKIPLESRGPTLLCNQVQISAFPNTTRGRTVGALYAGTLTTVFEKLKPRESRRALYVTLPFLIVERTLPCGIDRPRYRETGQTGSRHGTSNISSRAGIGRICRRPRRTEGDWSSLREFAHSQESHIWPVVALPPHGDTQIFPLLCRVKHQRKSAS